MAVVQVEGAWWLSRPTTSSIAYRGRLSRKSCWYRLASEWNGLEFFLVNARTKWLSILYCRTRFDLSVRIRVVHGDVNYMTIWGLKFQIFNGNRPSLKQFATSCEILTFESMGNVLYSNMCQKKKKKRLAVLTKRIKIWDSWPINCTCRTLFMSRSNSVSSIPGHRCTFCKISDVLEI